MLVWVKRETWKYNKIKREETGKKVYQHRNTSKVNTSIKKEERDTRKKFQARILQHCVYVSDEGTNKYFYTCFTFFHACRITFFLAFF